MPVLKGPTIKAMTILDTRALTQIKAVLFVNPPAVQKIVPADGHTNMGNQTVSRHWKTVLIASVRSTVVFVLDMGVVTFAPVARQWYLIVVVKFDLCLAKVAIAFKAARAW